MFLRLKSVKPLYLLLIGLPTAVLGSILHWHSTPGIHQFMYRPDSAGRLDR